MGPAYMNPANRGGNSVATAKSNGGGHASATAVTNGNGNANANSIANGNPNDYNDMPGNYDHLNNNANSNAVATAVSNGGGNAVASATSNGHGDAVATATSNTDHFDNRNGNTGIDVDNELDSSFKSRSASPDEEIEYVYRSVALFWLLGLIINYQLLECSLLLWVLPMAIRTTAQLKVTPKMST